MPKQLPVYEATIDASEGDNLGVNEIAFVNDPAILIKGVAYANQPKQRITAPALIPMNIYRYSEDIGEYEVKFTAEEIQNIVKAFQQKSNTNSFNLEHNTGIISPAYILESWFVEDPLTDKSKTIYGIDGLLAGTWMVTAQIKEKAYYDNLIENGQTGFSIEGTLGLIIKQSKQQKMNKTFKLADVKTQDGSALFINGDIAIGSEVFLITPTGDKVIPQDGDIVLEDGSSISVTNGVIDEVSAPGEEAKDVTEGETLAITPEVPAPAAPADMPKMLTEEDVNALVDSKLQDLIAKIAELQSAVEQLQNPVDTKTKMSKVENKEQKFSVTERWNQMFQ